jgi:hypothetical protein
MNTESLSHYYTVMLKEGDDDAFRWAFCAGLHSDEDGVTRVYVFGADTFKDTPAPDWQLVSIAGIDETAQLDGDDIAEKALVCSVAAQVLEDLAELSEDDDAPHQLRLLGARNLNEGAATARANAVDLLESRGPQAQLTPLEEAVWNILAGATID